MPFTCAFQMRPFTWVLVAILATIVGLLVAFCMAFSAPRYRGEASDHFDGKRFFNPGPAVHRSMWEVLRWSFTRTPGPWRPWVDAPPGPPPPVRVADGRMLVTFVNHSTFLLQMDGVNLLVDPVWSERASPVSWAGPKRHIPPGIRVGDLPPIDAILITHNHYDHLDLPTLRRLADFHHPRFLTGLGNKATLAKAGIAWGEDLDWWDGAELAGGVTVTFVPARHFSGRSQCDHDRTLWGGFVIRGPAGVIYAAGDTGLGPHFTEIRRRFGAPRLALLPIGAYLPRWFMGPVHLSPEEALDVHEELGAGTTVAAHFGTFQLGDDGQFQAVEGLAEALLARPQDAPHVWILRPGEGREVPAMAGSSQQSQ